MNDAQPAPDSRREELRQRFLSHAAAAFDLMFDPQYQDQLVTFDQREERACELGRDLTAWLLRQHVNADPQACLEDQLPPTCPKCGRPVQRVTVPEAPLPQRQITSLTGEVTLQREQWRCTTCRVVFFPLGPEAPARHGGLQPGGATQGCAAGR
jgi:hypothetical protein